MSNIKNEIIVIGAGISGLAAANYLINKGYKVKIIEARQRPGGRIWMDDSWGFPLAHGAHWVHGVENNPIVQLTKQFSSPCQTLMDKKRYSYTHTGQQVSLQTIQDFEEKFDLALHEVKQYAANKLQQDCPLSTALEHFFPTQFNNLFQSTLFCKKLTFFENYMGDNYERLSARYWDISEPGTGEHAIVLDAFSSIIKGLVKNCDISFNTPVLEIHYDSNKIELITDNKKYLADKVIITLPLGVLKKSMVKFNPPLPNTKQQAINAIGMGLLDIIWLQFPVSFWPENSSSLFIAHPDSSLTCKTFFNMQPFLQKPVLYGYVGGSTARVLENTAEQKIVTDLMQNLCSVFGEHIPNPNRFSMTHWNSDPFSFGSYSYVAVGAELKHFHALAKPISNRLYFAGEATNAHLYDATVHGAYLSGIREAKRIIQEEHAENRRGSGPE